MLNVRLLGVVLRLALPVSVFLMIVGFSFWADVEKRVDVTLQILLVVAALYLGKYSVSYHTYMVDI